MSNDLNVASVKEFHLMGTNLESSNFIFVGKLMFLLKGFADRNGLIYLIDLESGKNSIHQLPYPLHYFSLCSISNNAYFLRRNSRGYRQLMCCKVNAETLSIAKPIPVDFLDRSISTFCLDEQNPNQWLAVGSYFVQHLNVFDERLVCGRTFRIRQDAYAFLFHNRQVYALVDNENGTKLHRWNELGQARKPLVTQGFGRARNIYEKSQWVGKRLFCTYCEDFITPPVIYMLDIQDLIWRPLNFKEEISHLAFSPSNFLMVGSREIDKEDKLIWRLRALFPRSRPPTLMSLAQKTSNVQHPSLTNKIMEQFKQNSLSFV